MSWSLQWIQDLLEALGLAEPSPSTDPFTCDICMEESLPPEKRHKACKQCSYAYCTDCISMYIAAEVEDHQSQVKCPSPDCSLFLDPLVHRQILPAATFVRWCDILCESVVLETSSRAYCPFTDCSELVLNECNTKYVTETKCPNCKKAFCFKCKSPWHPGCYCDSEGVRKEKNDVLFNRLATSLQWRRCPRCDECVEHAGGCLRVRCRCGWTFCYLCGQEFPWYKFAHVCGQFETLDQLWRRFKNFWS